MSNSFIMTESIVRPAKMPYGRLKDNGFVGIEGEHAARALVVETKDDLSAFASINLIIDDLDCGAMTKTTSGNTTTLSMTLTSSMIGRSGRKICQLIMVNSGNTVVQKSSQFEAYVGRANEIERSVDDGVTIIILSEAVTEMAREAAAAAAEEAAAGIVDECQDIADAASASADAAAQSASDAQTAAASITVDATLDPTSTHAIQNKAVASEISSIKADLGAFGDLNSFNYAKGTTGTNNGVTYTYNSDGTWTVNGTSTSASFRTLISGLDGWTNGLKAGETYYIRYATTDNNVQLRIYPYVNGALVNEPVIFSGDGEYIIPTEASGIGVRLFVANGKTISNATCAVKFLNAPSNKDLENKFAQKIPYQKKIAFFGDSIMWGRDGNGSASTRVTDTIPTIVEKRLGVTCDNFGVGGMGYLRPADSTNEIAYDKIAGTDITGYDVIVLCFGVNDGFKTVGTWDSTDETTCLGQFNKIINYIYTQNPTATVIVFAPYNGTNAGSYPNYWYGTPGGNATSRQILSDALKQACEFYWIPYIEQKDSPINAKTITTALPDGVHPSVEYYRRLGDWFCGKL